jgi:cell wall-associated NlpC family hydrolase
MTMGVTGVLSRISELQNRLGLAPPPAPAAAGGASGTKFASALADATRGGSAAGAAGPSGDDVVSAAKKYLGTRYVFGSTDPSKGLDCSGLVQRAFQDMGV